jgi:hypothetical protein
MGNTQAKSLRRILCLALCILGPLVPESGHSAPTWVSRYSSSSNSLDIAENIVLGPDGSVYVSGFSEVDARWKGAIIKYSNAGQQLWAVENTNMARVNAPGPFPLTALDPGGGVRVAGIWAATTNEVFVASYSTTGTLLWERRFHEGSQTYPTAVDVDAFGNCVAVVWSRSSNQVNAVLVKYAPDGSLLWNRIYPLSPVYVSVATLPNGDILAGVGSQPGGARILKHSAGGELLWTTQVGRGVPWQIRVDASGNIFVANRGDVLGDEFIKLNASGELLWRRPAGPMAINQMTLDASGNLFAAGSGLVVVKLDSSGNELWRSRFAQPDSFIDIPQGIAAHGPGVSVGFAVYETSVSRQRVWAAHYDDSGVEVWRDSYTNAGGSVHGMVGDANQGVYVTGLGDPFPSDFQTLKFDVAAHPLRPTILSPPRDLEVIAGTNNASFSVTAANGPNTFQWRRNGTAIPDATNATLILANLHIDHAGGYSVIVSNSYDYVVTPEAQLTVYTPPELSWGIFTGTNQTLIAGNELLLRADVLGDRPITFEWRKDGTLLAPTNSVLIIEGVTAADSGVYTVVARSPFGSDTNPPVSVAVIPRSAVDEWRWVRPRPQGNALTAIAFGNGRFVAVGGGGVVLNSTSGTNWAVTHLTHFLLNGVSFGNGVFVIASRSGTIYSSADGLTWTVRAPPISADSWDYSVSFVNGRFVVNGQDIRSSLDGIEWTSHGVSPASSRPVAFGAGRYLIPVYGYNVTSTNFNDWTPQVLGNNSYELVSAAYGNGVFVINNWQELYTSPNGTGISNRYSVPYAVSVAFLNGRFFSVGASIETSADGAVWTRVAEGFDDPLWSIAHGNGIYVAVGLKGVIATSPDGQTWTRALRGLADLRGIAHGNGRYVIVGEEEAWTSTDGEAWSSISGPVADNPAGITFVNGTFVVVGGEGDLFTSKDGTTWTGISVATNDLRAVIHDGTRFVVVGERTAVFSTNGIGWTQVASSLVGSTAAIAFGNGTYVAAVVSGLRISTNALDWEWAFDAPHLRSLAFGNGRFVGIMFDGAPAVSTDGLTWDTYTLPPGFDAESVVFANGMFVASVGEGMATSVNGQDWTVHPTHDPFYSGQIFFANGALWLLGRDETIIRSAQLQPAIRARKTGTGFELIVEAWPSQTYRLQRATALGTWSDLQTFTPQTEITTLIDNNTSGSAFYRIVSP